MYGVVGEGLGHATRSQVILEHLQEEHEVQVVASRKAYNYLSGYFNDVTSIEGYEFEIDGNALDYRKTLASFFKLLPRKAIANLQSFMTACRKRQPELVISDFESFSYLYGKFNDLPVISIDNMQILNRCQIPVPAEHRKDYLLAKAVVKNKLPNCHHYLITTFFYPRVRKPNTDLFPPILRRSILEARASEKDHIFVYQTSTVGDELLPVLKEIDARFVIYGYGKERREGNLSFRGFSQQGFVADLASSRAVIANSGFSLLGEALFLGKPYLAVPVRRQFEQRLNGIYLEKLGYGECHAGLDIDVITGFLDRTPLYRENLETFEHDGNRAILARLDRLLDNLLN